jgi:hypothetical protein
MTMDEFPEYYRPANIEVAISGFGRIGIIYGYLGHYPIWYGVVF